MKTRDMLILGGVGLAAYFLFFNKKTSDSGTSIPVIGGANASPLDPLAMLANIMTGGLTAGVPAAGAAANAAAQAIKNAGAGTPTIQIAAGNAGALLLAQGIAAGQNVYSGGPVATAISGSGGASAINYASGVNILAATTQAASLGYGNVSTPTGAAYVPPPSSFSSSASYLSSAKSVGAALGPSTSGTAMASLMATGRI